MRFFWWLRHLVMLVVRVKVSPPDPAKDLGLKPGVPVCYILPSSSTTDLLALEHICRERGLPLPHHTRHSLKVPGSAAFIYMQKMGLLQARRGGDRQPPTPLTNLVKEAHADHAMEVQLVPVSLYWGRNPGREERSIFKLLFFDDERAGKLQKLFIVLAQGRASFMHFGKPISLRELVAEDAGPDDTARKLRRVLRVHFRTQRTGAMGPVLPSREAVITHIVSTKTVRQAIAEEARKKKTSEEKAEGLARKYLDEIAADTQYSMVRFFDVVLSWVFNRVLDGIVVRHSTRLAEIDKTCEIVYLPSHRSHLDYLLLTYSLFYEGYVTPHIAAGVNLDFWPIGPLLRRGGAFFLRRTFSGNRLYATVFNEYVHYLLVKGHSMKFYLEGGRSRTGRLLAPKTGMLGMVVHSYLRNREKPIVLVPVYLGYDKVMEVKTYQSELRGKQKRKESVGQLMKARRVLKQRYGKAYIGFGEPIHLEQALDDAHPGWREETADAEQKPKWLGPFVGDLALETLTRVNSTAVVSPLAIFALVILSSPQRALAEEELLYLMAKLAASMRSSPYSRDVSLPEGNEKDWLKHAMSVCKVERFEHPSGDVIHLEERESVLLTYYRNNVLHLVAVPSLVASFFQHNEAMDELELVESCALLYPFLRSEFYLRWDADQGPKVVKGVIDALVGQRLLFRDGASLRRPDFTTRDFSSLRILARALGQTLERYAVSTALLAQQQSGEPFDRKDFETRCQLMAQRISILNGINEPEFFDKSLFKNYIDLLKDLKYAADAGEGRLVIDAQVRGIAERSLNLLSGDLRQSIQRLSEKPVGPLER